MLREQNHLLDQRIKTYHSPLLSFCRHIQYYRCSSQYMLTKSCNVPKLRPPLSCVMWPDKDKDHQRPLTLKQFFSSRYMTVDLRFFSAFLKLLITLKVAHKRSSACIFLQYKVTLKVIRYLFGLNCSFIYIFFLTIVHILYLNWNYHHQHKIKVMFRWHIFLTHRLSNT